MQCHHLWGLSPCITNKEGSGREHHLFFSIGPGRPLPYSSRGTGDQCRERHLHFTWPWLAVSYSSRGIGGQVCSKFQIFSDCRQPPLAVAGPCNIGSGGGMYQHQPQGHTHRAHVLHEARLSWDWPGGHRFGGECSPTTIGNKPLCILVHGFLGNPGDLILL
jgi:hypothetical protein